MMESTSNCMFNLDKCIDYMFNWLVNYTDIVDTKFRQFSNIACDINDPRDVIASIQNSEYFDHNELIDCELLALAF